MKFSEADLKIVEVHGQSMWPHLRHQDLVLVESSGEKPGPTMGDVVLVRSDQANKDLVHRVVDKGKSKGDQSLKLDHVSFGEVEILGVVRGRVSVGSRSWVNYEKGHVKFLHRQLARLSLFNQQQYPLKRRLANKIINLLGHLTRMIEDKNAQ